ncbi:MAG: hypothetical protein RLZZ347_75 [Candidatus Parcubacteria bacterium]
MVSVILESAERMSILSIAQTTARQSQERQNLAPYKKTQRKAFFRVLRDLFETKSPICKSRIIIHKQTYLSNSTNSKQSNCNLADFTLEYQVVMPGWRNGRRNRLKIDRQQCHESSSLSPGTKRSEVMGSRQTILPARET